MTIEEIRTAAKQSLAVCPDVPLLVLKMPPKQKRYGKIRLAGRSGPLGQIVGGDYTHLFVAFRCTELIRWCDKAQGAIL